MQESLDNNNMLMYSTLNESKSIITEWIIKTLKVKIFKKRQLIVASLTLLI